MLNLFDYLEINRINKPVTLTDSWYGEMIKGTRPVFYDVPTLNQEKKVFAFISYPTTKKPKNGYPALLLIHGGNGQAFYEMSRLWADRGFITICPDFNGKYAHDVNDRQNVNLDGGYEGYGAITNLKEEHNWAYFSVLSAMRAIDVLLSLDEVDKDNIFSCGLSWGGVIQLLLSSVENRIKSASVIYSSAYISNSEWGNKVLSSLSHEDKTLWNGFIDPKSYLSKINHPVFFTAGTDDIAFKMESRRLTSNAINSPVYFALKKNFPHGNFYGFEQFETLDFFNRIIGCKKIPKPMAKLDGRRLKVTPFDKKSKLELCFTKDDVEVADKQNWETIKINRNYLLKEQISAFFIIEKLKDGSTWTSDMIRVK